MTDFFWNVHFGSQDLKDFNIRANTPSPLIKPSGEYFWKVAVKEVNLPNYKPLSDGDVISIISDKTTATVAIKEIKSAETVASSVNEVLTHLSLDKRISFSAKDEYLTISIQQKGDKVVLSDRLALVFGFINNTVNVSTTGERFFSFDRLKNTLQLFLDITSSVGEQIPICSFSMANAKGPLYIDNPSYFRLKPVLMNKMNLKCIDSTGTCVPVSDFEAMNSYILLHFIQFIHHTTKQ